MKKIPIEASNWQSVINQLREHNIKTILGYKYINGLYEVRVK